MRILFLDSPAFAKQDMIDAFTACGIACDLFFMRRTTTGRMFLTRRSLTPPFPVFPTILFFPLIIFQFCQTVA